MFQRGVTASNSSKQGHLSIEARKRRTKKIVVLVTIPADMERMLVFSAPCNLYQTKNKRTEEKYFNVRLVMDTVKCKHFLIEQHENNILQVLYTMLVYNVCKDGCIYFSEGKLNIYIVSSIKCRFTYS